MKIREAEGNAMTSRGRKRMGAGERFEDATLMALKVGKKPEV